MVVVIMMMMMMRRRYENQQNCYNYNGQRERERERESEVDFELGAVHRSANSLQKLHVFWGKVGLGWKDSGAGAVAFPSRIVLRNTTAYSQHFLKLQQDILKLVALFYVRKCLCQIS